MEKIKDGTLVYEKIYCHCGFPQSIPPHDHNSKQKKNYCLRDINILRKILKHVKSHSDGYDLNGKYRVHRPGIDVATARNWQRIILMVKNALDRTALYESK